MTVIIIKKKIIQKKYSKIFNNNKITVTSPFKIKLLIIQKLPWIVLLNKLKSPYRK